MVKISRIVTALLLATVSAVKAEDALADTDRLVVAIRYFQPIGPSHAHLFLYNGTGKLLRQLTNAPDGQDRDPVFSPDGKTAVFRRESKTRNEFWSVAVEAGKPQRITTVPSWYFTALKRPLADFDFPPTIPTTSDPKELRIKDSIMPDDVHYADFYGSCLSLVSSDEENVVFLPGEREWP